MLDYIYLAGGLAILLLAGDVLVRGSVTLARSFGIPSLVIGLTIVAFGTSAPELVISLRSALDGVSGIAVGNVVGSNIANVLLVMGVPALIATTACTDKGVRKNAAFLVAVTVVFTAMCTFGEINRAMGIVLLALLGLFLFDSYREMRCHQRRCQDYQNGNEEALDDAQIAELEEFDEVPGGRLVAGALVVAGLIGLPLGGQLAIMGAVDIARDWGVTDTAIGLTVIALGTSLPELATTVMAAMRKQSAVALGNVLGSNVFNIVAILGVTAVIVPLDVPPAIMRYDIWVMMATTVLLAIFAFMRSRLRWPLGLALVAGYCLYIFFVFASGKVA
ncbi:cation:H+ antiporter [Breoghania corrubedonensis]|uniref:Cation:H+ antiporter n=1 Tax=Breoghania corrubedonensis TaxID=665038 RepID=A0A2T5UP68_9HYPH|nr:calcium/sodium antiporter [Breoghania corrubedonensis]PTW53211.1 cation:H+ antiporter [Breoghania corrubedonensis]